MTEKALDILQRHQLRNTAVRRQVLEQFLQAGHKALSNSDLEDALENPDRITLYRTLKTFEQKGIVHQAIDGSGTTKYALCQDECSEHEHHDDHAHFHCHDCGKTICLEGSIKSAVQLPEGFQVQQKHFVLEGTCADCHTE